VDFTVAEDNIVPTVRHSAIATKYRSGVLYKVSAQKLYILTGRLVGESGEPISYIGGQVKSANGENIDITFTDDTGTFQVYGLLPGEYVIDWSSVIGTIQVKIIDTESGVFDIGAVTPVLNTDN